MVSHAELIYDWNVQGIHFSMEREVTFDDETLRDGLQSPSITDPPIEKKIELLHIMDSIGIETADVGLPGAGPRAVADVTALVEEIGKSKLKITPNRAARTVFPDIDPIYEITQKTGVPILAATFLGCSQIRQYTESWDLNRLLKLTADAVTYAVNKGLEVMFVTEDTTRAHPQVIAKLYTEAIRCGAKRITIADTVGHATPVGAYNLVSFLKHIIDGLGAKDVKIDWHGHRDRALSIANSIAAYIAGADQLHGTALGVGERCGNTPMELLLVNLHLMKGLEGKRLDLLPKYVQLVSESYEVPIPSNYPVFGSDAFETATGVHAAAVIKAFRKNDLWLANRVYSGVPADLFGMEQKIRIGPMSGKSNIIFWLEKQGIEPKEELVEKIFDKAKQSNRLLTDEEILSIINTPAS
ncbi:MAG: 2-isopropylmalate synthase [Planctomycetota bacterium]|nr:MAG: 2-isopropylmalate synthase [Planctomycetota bacterium]